MVQILASHWPFVVVLLIALVYKNGRERRLTVIFPYSLITEANNKGTQSVETRLY